MKKYNKIFVSIITVIVMLCVTMSPISVTAATQTGIIVNVDSYLNVRSGAGTTYSSIGQLSNSQSVTIVGSESGWYKIVYGDGYGYVSADFVSIVDSPDIPDTTYDFEEYLDAQGFPETYKAGLRTLHSKYPSWVFVAQNIKPNWPTVIKNESKVGNNMVAASSPAEQKSFDEGAFNWSTNTWYGLDGNWVAASEQIVSWAMDPRNFLTENHIFQFEKLSYVETQTVSGVSDIISGTFMAGEYPGDEYDTYAEAIMQAAKESKVSAYHLASRLKQEQGAKGNPLAHGTVDNYKGYYNFFNINTYDTAANDMYVNGAIYAKKKGWNTPYKAILGGAQFIAGQYILKEQDTLYLQKFDVTDGNNGYYNHQYMSNVFAPSNEAARMKSAYSEATLNSPLVFYIPVYKNMPDSACVKPTRSLNNNNLLSSLTISGFALSPTFYRYTTEYSLVIEKENVTSVTINAKTSNTTHATVSGAGTVNLQNGLNTVELVVTAPSGVKRTYTIDITLKSSAQKPTVTTDYKIDKYITGIEPETSVSSFKSNLGISGGSARVYNPAGKELTSGNIGTGSIVRIYNSTGVEMNSYQAVVYGDNNGDGAISVLDLLRIQKHLLSVQTFEGAYLESCDTTRNGVIDVVDLLREQKYLLDLAEINQ